MKLFLMTVLGVFKQYGWFWMVAPQDFHPLDNVHAERTNN